MKQNLYSVFDTIAQVFKQVITSHNDGTAQRDFCEAFKDHPHKNDYTLYRIGEFTDHDGVIKSLENPIKIQSGFEIGKENTEVPESLKEQAS